MTVGGLAPIREYSVSTCCHQWWNAATMRLRRAPEHRPPCCLRAQNAAKLRCCTSNPQQASPHSDACTPTVRGSRMTDVSLGPSGSALCALALGHCLCVPPGGGRPRRRPASENPQVRLQSSNSAFTPSIGPLLTRACVPVCVRRCDRARRASERRHLPRGHHHGRFHPRRPLRRPPRPLKRGARNAKKIEPAHACAPPYRRVRRPLLPPLPPRCPSPRLTSCTG